MIDIVKKVGCNKCVHGLKDWVRPEGLFKHNGFSVSRQKYLRRKGRLPYSRIGSYIIYHIPSVDALFDRHEVVPLDDSNLELNHCSGCRYATSKSRTWCTPMQLWQILGFSTQNQGKLRKNHILPYRQIGNYIRYDALELNKLFHNHSVRSLDDILKK